ncbi:MAG TPA: dihydroorotate dehydrogenase electron transfer subunit, partial [Dehalococcoidia bacterium]|nr:dihydroorotate dehydrogenase electron transfer subunit [Dehalococcoidia bacterium]
RADQVFACGPPGMYRDMASRREMFEGRPVQVSRETRMGCGRGICYSCTIKTISGLKQVCTDGPVFSLDEILWEELID